MAVAVVDRPVPTPAPPTGVPAQPVGIPAPPPPGRVRGLRARIAALLAPPDPLERELLRLRRLAAARALLERSRRTVAEGWVQDAFYVVRDQRGELRPVSPFGLLVLSRGDVAGACLVGAVAHASSTLDRRERRGPSAAVVDLLWAELAARCPSAVTGPYLLPVWEDPHPTARAARVRDLAQWNDDPRRTRDEVLDLIDGAVARTGPFAGR